MVVAKDHGEERMESLMDVCVSPQSLSLVQPFCNPMDCSPPGLSVHGIFQAKILGWGLGRGASLVVQWLKIPLVMQRTPVQSLVREDHKCLGAIKPVYRWSNK